MKIAVLKEVAANESRVGATPETVKKLIGLGASVAVESGAGAGARIADADYAAAGAIVAGRAEVIAGAQMVLGIQAPQLADLPGGDHPEHLAP
jgi:NAD(P) transhydrogenase subunit alpha